MKPQYNSLLAGLILTIAQTATAQTPPAGMSQEQMQAMMGKMQEMQTCMQQVDFNSMQQLQQRSEQVRNKLKSLCASGETDAVRSTALEFANEIKQHPAMQQMQKCQQIMQGMPMMPKAPMQEFENRIASSDICANLQ